MPRIKWFLCGVALLLGASISGSKARCATSPEQGMLMSVSFREAPLVDVLSALEEVAGRRVTVAPDLQADELCTVRVERQPVEAVLNAILNGRGYSWSYVGESLETQGIVAHTYLVVERVVPNSLAEKAGMRPGDIIRTVNGRGIQSRVEASDALGQARDGVRVTFSRQGSLNELEVGLSR